MKIVLIYRKLHPEAFSIEELFSTIGLELQKHVEVIHYVAGSRLNVFADAWRLRNMKADVYHITGDINYLACLLPKQKTVLTLHDIVHYLYDLTGFKKLLYKYLWFIWPIAHAARVTAISDSTAESIVKNFKISKPIHVITNCYNPIYKPVEKAFNKVAPTILQIGTLTHKNIPRLIEAIAEIPCKLIIIGRIDNDTNLHLKKYNIIYENYIGISRDEIYQQYINCDIVSFISLYEGFGMPIIEAQAVGRALITSSLSPMNVVAGVGAAVVDPYDISQIRQEVLKIIQDSNYRQKVIQHGLNNATNYSVTTISQKYLSLYETMS